MENLDEIVQQKLDADVDFTATLKDLSDEDKSKAIEKKKSEITNAEFVSLKKERDEADQKFLDQKARAKKAEEDGKKNKPLEDSLSQSDLLAVAKADIHEDDMEEVIEFAKFKKIAIKDALKNESLQVILKDRVEKRKSAEVAQAKPRGGSQQEPNADAILKDAMNNNILPSKGSDEAEKLFWARRGGKK